MKKKIELDDLDVVFDPTPLTEDEKRRISDYIRLDKAKRGRKTPGKDSLAKRRVARV